VANTGPTRCILKVHNRYPSVLFSAIPVTIHLLFYLFFFSSSSFSPLVRPIWLVVGGWLFACGIAGFVMMGADKARAVDGRRRYRESTLLLWAFMGGFWGLLFGAAHFHHKTRKRVFIAVACFAAILWLAILYGMVRSFGPP
jgi:uncharacterized membrane protein YsdA (DUF1294 family)